MVSEAFRNEWGRLLNGRDERSRMDAYMIIIDSGFKILSDIRDIKYGSSITNEANLIYQMSMLKMLSCSRLIAAIRYQNPYTDFILTDLRDPFSVWAIIRAQFEAFCNFNHIYRYHDNQDMQKLIYQLWVLSGLKYRQRHEVSAGSSIEKMGKEKVMIEELVSEIESSQLYISLPLTEQTNIKRSIKEKDWKITYDGGVIKKLDWQKLFNNAGCHTQMKTFYNFLSTNTHPSNVSVFQFKEMYRENFHHQSTLIALNFSAILGAFLISDYCFFSPAAKLSFNSLPKMNQLVINSQNRVFRSPKYAVNDIEQELFDGY